MANKDFLNILQEIRGTRPAYNPPLDTEENGIYHDLVVKSVDKDGVSIRKPFNGYGGIYGYIQWMYADIASGGTYNAYDAEAFAKTSQSFAVQPVNEDVIVFTSNGDGTYTETPQVGVRSSLHYSLNSEIGGAIWLPNHSYQKGDIVTVEEGVSIFSVYVARQHHTSDPFSFITDKSIWQDVTGKGADTSTSIDFDAGDPISGDPLNDFVVVGNVFTEADVFSNGMLVWSKYYSISNDGVDTTITFSSDRSVNTWVRVVHK